MNPVFILAKDPRGVEGIAWRFGIPRDKWRPVRDQEDLYGQRGGILLRANNWCEHPKADYIMEVARTQDMWVWTEQVRLI